MASPKSEKEARGQREKRKATLLRSFSKIRREEKGTQGVGSSSGVGLFTVNCLKILQEARQEEKESWGQFQTLGPLSLFLVIHVPQQQQGASGGLQRILVTPWSRQTAIRTDFLLPPI